MKKNQNFNQEFENENKQGYSSKPLMKTSTMNMRF